MNIIDHTIQNLQKALNLAKQIRTRQNILTEENILPRQKYIVSEALKKDIKQLDTMLGNLDNGRVTSSTEQTVRIDMVTIAEAYNQ